VNKAKWIVLAVVVLALAGCWMGPAPEPQLTTATKARPLRVITYNAQFLPLRRLNKRGKGPYRAAELVKRLAAYDIVGLNEIFEAARREQILELLEKEWGSEFQCVTPREEDRSALGLDSGLVLATRLPIVESHTLVFGNDSQMVKNGVLGDGFVAKGALHARIRRPGPDGKDMLIDSFVTHLESVDPDRRAAQYAKLAEFIREHSVPSNPIILMGDLNTVGDRTEMDDPQSQYHGMLNSLIAARPGWQDLGLIMDAGQWGTSDPEAPGGGQRIDYIFFSSGGDAAQLRPLRANTLPLRDPRVKFLSDHCAVEAEFE
jgi:endonuclease/exonuclease/phosphatase family metal-dependent hydrolase